MCCGVTLAMFWMNEWMNEYDLSDAITETVQGHWTKLSSKMALSVSTQRGNDAANRWVFRCWQKDPSDDVDRTLGGNEFQARAATTGNARSRRVDRRVDGTTSVDVLADQSLSGLMSCDCRGAPDCFFRIIVVLPVVFCTCPVLK